jgi:hypothetical protein
MYTPVVLDKTRNFRFGMKAIHLIEQALKTSVAKLDMDNLTMEQTAIIIWAGLVHEDKQLTPDKVMDLVDEYSSLPKALKLMGDAFARAFDGGVVDEGVVEEGKNE